jgi:hypothetical protein
MSTQRIVPEIRLPKGGHVGMQIRVAGSLLGISALLTCPQIPHGCEYEFIPSPELWQSGKRRRRFPSSPSLRLFHSSLS